MIDIMVNMGRVCVFAMCISTSLSTFGTDAKPPQNKSSFTESELRMLSTTMPTVKTAGQLYSVAKATTTNATLRQKYLKCAAACLFACGRKDLYIKYIQNELDHPRNVEDELKEPCKRCSGQSRGREYRQCSTCNGKSICSTCKGTGQTVHVSFSGNKYNTCRKCNGTGECARCGGEGSIKNICWLCDGEGKQFSKNIATTCFRITCCNIAEYMKNEPLRKAAEEKARKEAEALAKIEAAKKEKERKAAQQLAERMTALGLVDISGKWMTPGSVRYVTYRILQIYKPGHALCTDGTGRVFCLLYSVADNRNISEGDILINDLYRCGTYSYITVLNAPSTVAKFAIDLSVALKEIRNSRD